MKRKWFSGNYRYLDVINGTEKIVTFSKNGFFHDGEEVIPYSVNSYFVAAEDKPDILEDYLLFEESKNVHKYFILEY